MICQSLAESKLLITRPLTDISTQLPAIIGMAHRSATGRCGDAVGIRQSGLGAGDDSQVLATAGISS